MKEKQIQVLKEAAKILKHYCAKQKCKSYAFMCPSCEIERVSVTLDSLANFYLESDEAHAAWLKKNMKGYNKGFSVTKISWKKNKRKAS